MCVSVCVCVCECEQLPALSSENEEKIARAQAGTPVKHKQAVRMNNGVAAHVHNEDHQIDWEEAKVIGQQEFYWKRRVTEAILIHQHNQQTMNFGLWLKLEQTMACIT